MPWFIVATHPQAERRVESGFTELGVKCYVPREIRQGTRPRSKLKVKVIRVLVPGYAFVWLEGEPNFAVLRRSVEGVARFLAPIGSINPVPIPGEFVERMQSAEARGLFDYRPNKVKPKFEEGQDVRILDGAFAGFVAKVAQTRDRDRRLKVFVETLGSLTTIYATKDQLEPLEAPKREAA